jgi:hypothetical protein
MSCSGLSLPLSRKPGILQASPSKISF